MAQILVVLAELVSYVVGLAARVAIINQFNQWLQHIIGSNGAPIAEGSLLGELYTTYNSVLEQGALLADGTYGLSAAHTERAAILSAISGIPAPDLSAISDQLTAILDAIGALPPPSDPAPTSDANAAAVWNALIADPWTAGQCLYHLHERFMHDNGLAARHVKANSWFFVYYPVGMGD